MEQLLHYVWKHKIFPLGQLHTVTGEPVEVIDPGLPNHNAGPDFFNAKVRIGGTLWAGNVEIHTVSSDWKRHGHDKDKAYDTVILHIATQVDCQITGTDGRLIHQMQLSCPESIRQRYEELRMAEFKPPCYSIVPSLSKLVVHSWFSALQSERFEQKTNIIKNRLQQLNNHWEDAFFITLARNFGFGVNGDAFEAWASQLPFRAVDKHRDSLFQVEALFFGHAGLLDNSLPDEYYRELQKEYRYLAQKFSLERKDPAQWKYLRMRPGNFPHVRVAQLAWLYHNRQGLFSQVIDAGTIETLRPVLQANTSSYWEEHYNFDKISPRKPKTLGAGSVNLLIINTVIPFLYAYGLSRNNEIYCLRANSFLESLKAENNYVTKLWDGTGISVNTAADSQALLQLQKEYCDKKKCLYCRFGYEYLKVKSYHQTKQTNEI